MSEKERVYATPFGDGAQIIVKRGESFIAVAVLTEKDADDLEKSLRYMREDRERRTRRASTQ